MQILRHTKKSSISNNISISATAQFVEISYVSNKIQCMRNKQKVMKK